MRCKGSFTKDYARVGSNGEAMQDLTVKRTLVKSPPELWSELSEVERLAKHLDAFGEIKITRLEPESTVAWEGEGASGTVSIEPSGWGTKVTLTARVEGEEPAPEPELAPEPEPAPIAEPAAPAAPVAAPVAESPAPTPDAAPEPEPVELPRRGLFSRLFGRERRRAAPAGGGGEQPVWVAGAPAVDAVAVEPVASEPVEPEPVVAEPVAAEPAAEPVEREPVDAEPASDTAGPIGPQRAQAALEGVLEALGSAHHRPFSRG
jgi:hypothetical protein